MTDQHPQAVSLAEVEDGDPEVGQMVVELVTEGVADSEVARAIIQAAGNLIGFYTAQGGTKIETQVEEVIRPIARAARDAAARRGKFDA
jgi:hypothetical protein